MWILSIIIPLLRARRIPQLLILTKSFLLCIINTELRAIKRCNGLWYQK